MAKTKVGRNSGTCGDRGKVNKEGGSNDRTRGEADGGNVTGKRGLSNREREFGEAVSVGGINVTHLKSGKTGKKVEGHRQAIAIGLSESRKKGAKTPPRPKKK